MGRFKTYNYLGLIVSTEFGKIGKILREKNIFAEKPGFSRCLALNFVAIHNDEQENECGKKLQQKIGKIRLKKAGFN